MAWVTALYRPCYQLGPTGSFPLGSCSHCRDRLRAAAVAVVVAVGKPILEQDAVHELYSKVANPPTIAAYTPNSSCVRAGVACNMCGITPNPLAEHENDDYENEFCAEALLSLQTAKEQELDRFYCPFPGCKRSFAEPWWVSYRRWMLNMLSTPARAVACTALAKITSEAHIYRLTSCCFVVANAGG